MLQGRKGEKTRVGNPLYGTKGKNQSVLTMGQKGRENGDSGREKGSVLSCRMKGTTVCPTHEREEKGKANFISVLDSLPGRTLVLNNVLSVVPICQGASSWGPRCLGDINK